GGELDEAGVLPAPEDRAVSARQGDQPGPDLAAALRRRSRRPRDAVRPRGAGNARDPAAARDGARHDAPADAERNAGAARGAPRPPERLVARYGAATARPATGQVGGALAPGHGPGARQPARALPCAVDARRPRRARRGA